MTKHRFEALGDQRKYAAELDALFASGGLSDLCPNGHMRTLQNTRMGKRGDTSGGKFYVRCNDCQREFSKRAAPRKPGERSVLKKGGYAAGEWAKDALCLDLPSAMVLSITLSTEDEAFMARTCGACPVSALCLEWAGDQPLFEGIAGGRTFIRGKSSLLVERQEVAA